MGPEIGGYHSCPDFPKMGPSLLIASCLILAIRTAKWPPQSDPITTSGTTPLNYGPDFIGVVPNRGLPVLWRDL